MVGCNINFNVDVNRCLSRLWATPLLGRPKSGIKKLKKEMIRLRGKRDDIKNQIDQAEREGKIPTNEVSQWLREVEELEDQVAVINHDFQSMSSFSCNCFHRTGGTSSQTQQEEDITLGKSSNCCSIIWRVAKKLGEANELMSRAAALDLIATVGPPEPTVTLPISHQPPVGIESYVKDIVGYLGGEEDNIIGIYGMGGVGKTTILNNIRRHYLKHSIFDHVIWVVASRDCQLKRLQMDIAKSLGLYTLKENENEQACGDKLFRFLKNRKCLLLLDDIWEHVDLQLLGMAHSATDQGQQSPPRKVVVFTTRSETVCAQTKAQKKIKIKCLDSNQAWRLFKENSDGDVLSSDAGIESVAQELAKECAGLPLALITVARAMSGKKSWEAWKDALHEIRDKHKWTINGLSEDELVMYKAFKLSYDSLENDSIRECLLCCALWPEDYEIHKFKELIPCWIGCGIIREFNVINEAFDKGCSYLESLIAASLLEHSSIRHEDCYKLKDYYEAQHVKMHDVIRDMTLLMVSGLKGNGRKWIVKAGIGLKRLPKQEEWQEAERASFMDNKIKSLQDYEASTFPKLSMLILHNNFLKKIPSKLFTSMPLLTYLDISKCGTTELPMEICNLTELQYLNLSENPMKTLPKEFGRLGKLEYLLLRDTYIETVPNGTISNLSMLKWLDITYEYYLICEQWWVEFARFGGHQINLAIVIDPVYLKKLEKLPNVSVWNLTLKGSISLNFLHCDLSALRWSPRVSDNLECLTISDVPGDKLMMNAGVDWESSFRCLKTLNLSDLEQLEKIWLNGVAGFNNLRDLRITRCLKLKDVSWVLQLPFLNLLRIQECHGMKELISNVDNSNSNSSIRMLSLICMKNLHRIARQPLHFPYLEYLQVSRCPMFKKLLTEILSNKLKEITGNQDW